MNLIHIIRFDLIKTEGIKLHNTIFANAYYYIHSKERKRRDFVLYSNKWSITFNKGRNQVYENIHIDNIHNVCMHVCVHK